MTAGPSPVLPALAADIAISSGAVARVSRAVTGHFLESAFFRNVEGGVFDEGSRFAVTGHGALDGCREDVIDACRSLGLPVVRWPGGNFTSGYAWQDGTGPRDERPRRLELAWGSEESNRFGTPEFLAWCDAVGAEPYLHHGARSVDDAVRWVEYTNWAGDTTLTRRRAADGHPDPYGVRWWGIGNEVYGPWQMGHRSAARYVEDAREHMRFMRQVDPALRFVVSGWEDQAWTSTVVGGLGDLADGVSLHWYGVDRHLTDPGVREFDAVVGQPVAFERILTEYADRVAAAADDAGGAVAGLGTDRPFGIVVDEWNNRHLEPGGMPEPQPSEDGGVRPRDVGFVAGTVPDRVNRYSPRTLADALLYAGVFHAMRRSAANRVPVTMANAVNLVNANGLLAVRPDGVVRSAVWHVWDLYQNVLGPNALRAVVTAPAVFGDVRSGASDMRPSGEPGTRPAAVSMLDVSAAVSDDGDEVTVAAVNRSAHRPITATISLDGRIAALPRGATRWTVGADVDDLWAVNLLGDEPVRVVGPEPCTIDDGAHTFPPHSVTVLRFVLR